MKKLLVFLLLFPICIIYSTEAFDLPFEYSKDEFQRGIRAFHNCQYELAIVNFTKSLSFYDDNHQSRYFLGESYRKAGYEKNALFEWNSLLSKGYRERSLKNKISLLYNKRGMIDDIFVNKGYLLREDIKGYYDDKTPPLFIKPAQIAIDKNNNYYITSFLDGKIVVLDPNLQQIKSFLSTISGFSRPFGIAIDKNGFTYISDFKNDEIVKIDALGIVERKIGYKGIGVGGLLGPKHLLIDDDNNLYVSDSGNKRINKYKPNGEILFSFGDKKNSEENLSSPNGLLFHNNKIYVCDRDSDRVVIFDKNGNFISTIGEDKLKKPYDITIDFFGRFLVLCEKELWAYEEKNNLWYVIDALGSRLDRGISITTDRDKNILINDFNNSRFYILSPERTRYTNFNVNIERVFSNNFPNVHIAVKVENEDLSIPVGLNNSNFFIYENGKNVTQIGSAHSLTRDNINDVIILFDKNTTMKKYSEDFKLILDQWYKSKNDNTNIALFSIAKDDVIIENDFSSGRLSLLDSINNFDYSKWSDKGYGIKNAINYMVSRFSKKSIILVTNGNETTMDFNKFKIEDVISFASNNDITINILSFSDGNMTELQNFITKKTGGEYFRAYKRADLKNMLNIIENKKGSEIILSYKSNSISRFSEEPINIYLEVNYSGITGATQSVYFPPKL